LKPSLATTALGQPGITAYRKNGGTLEKAAAELYDRRCDDLSLDEVERIVN